MAFSHLPNQVAISSKRWTGAIFLAIADTIIYLALSFGGWTDVSGDPTSQH